MTNITHNLPTDIADAIAELDAAWADYKKLMPLSTMAEIQSLEQRVSVAKNRLIHCLSREVL